MIRPTTPPAEDSQSLFGFGYDVWKGWEAFWFKPADPTALCFMRICAGLLVFYLHLTYSWDLLGYIGPEAWVDQDCAYYMTREIPIYCPGGDWSDAAVKIDNGNYYWSVFFHVTDPRWLVALHVGFLGCMLLFALGLWTRVTSVLTWVAAMCYVQRASSTVYGVDTMVMIALFYLMIGPCGAVLSLDRWLEKRRARLKGEPVPEVEPSVAANFALRLFQVHFCVIYLATGTSKLLGVTWWSGTALNYVVLNSSFAPMDQLPYYNLMKFLASHRWLWETLMTLGIGFTLLVEISFPFLVWNPRWRWVMVCCSILLHTGIGLSMGLVSFSLMMMVMVLSFVPGELIAGWCDGVVGAVGRLGSRAAKEPELALSR